VLLRMQAEHGPVDEGAVAQIMQRLAQ
jgi:hypothetical protein